jgi:Uma2 family endonuclease
MAHLRDLHAPTPTPVHERLEYVRPPRPIRFPVEEEAPVSYEHLVLRTFLFRVLSFALGPNHTVCSDQFVYWIASDPRIRLSPDVFVKLNRPQPPRLGSWQTWKHGGAPDVAVEIVSPNEGDGVPWEEKIERYHQLGVEELVRYDPLAPEGRRLRAWDRYDDDFVERLIHDEKTKCRAFGLFWAVRRIPPQAKGGPEFDGLRLIDEEGPVLESPEEAEARARAAETQRAEAESQRAEAESQRADAEARGRADAEARVRALEEELRLARASRGDAR